MSPRLVQASSSRLRSSAVSRRLRAISASFPMLARAASWAVWLMSNAFRTLAIASTTSAGPTP